MDYNFRKLKASDIAPMCKIISKIGIKEISKCFESESIKSLISSAKNENKEKIVDAAGLQVVFDIADILLTHISDCENDIFKFLSNVSGLKFEDVKELSLVDFTDMIISLVKQSDFSDFIGVVSKLSK